MSAVAVGALERALEVTRAGGHPLALLDLDLTLVDNGPRTRAILRRWLEGVDARRVGGGAAVEAALARAETMPLAFSIRDNLFRALGFQPGAAVDEGALSSLAEGLAFWREAFFDPEWLVHDTALEGAVEAVRVLVEHEVTVCYVTARKVDMAAGTVSSLRRLGFPIGGPFSALITNDHPSRGDHASKVVALDYCARLGTVVLNAENEPAHANTMWRRFPEALTVLVETRHSEPAPPLESGVLRVRRVLDAL